MEPLVFISFLRTFAACYDTETISLFLKLLVSHGFRVIAETENEIYADVVPEVSQTLQQDVDAYLAQRNAPLFFRAYYVGDIDLSLLFQLVPEEGLLACMVEQEHFYGSVEGHAAYLTMVAIFKELCGSWHPLYGHTYYSSGVNPERAVVLSDLNVVALYYINLFGPELVNKLGRERLLSAPAWQIEELADGSIFLVPEDHVEAGGGGYSLKKVADYLGINTPQSPGEEWEE
jgi:hypothetical protein